MEEIKVSVIIPVYNIEKYVVRALDCLIEQTYANIEIIVVDDGAKDNSYKVCEEFAKKDNRITIYRKENGGLSSARNYGAERATGDYFLFLDGDDFIAPTAIENLVKIASSTDADIAFCKMKKVYENGKRNVWRKNKNKKATELTSREYKKLLMTGNTLDFCLVGTHLYKTDLVKKCPFDVNLPHGEDIVFNYRIADSAQKIVYLPQTLMAYYQRKGSLVNSAFSVRRFPLMTVLEKIAEENKEDRDLRRCINTWLYFSALESFYFMMRDKVVDKKSYLYLRNILKNNKKEFRNNKSAKIFRRIFAPIGASAINLFIKRENKK